MAKNEVTSPLYSYGYENKSFVRKILLVNHFLPHFVNFFLITTKSYLSLFSLSLALFDLRSRNHCYVNRKY